MLRSRVKEATISSGSLVPLAWLSVVVAAGAPALVGCSGGAEADGKNAVTAEAPAEGQVASPDVVNGTLVYSLELNAGHTIKFYKMAGGRNGVLEVRPIDEKKPVLDRLSVPRFSLADIYRLAQPDAKEVPTAILQADSPPAGGQPTRAMPPASPIRGSRRTIGRNTRSPILPTPPSPRSFLPSSTMRMDTTAFRHFSS
jgi:hypothetical protein